MCCVSGAWTSLFQTGVQSAQADAIARIPMKLHLEKDRLHKDVGKAPGTKITEADIAKEKSKGMDADCVATSAVGRIPRRWRSSGVTSGRRGHDDHGRDDHRDRETGSLGDIDPGAGQTRDQLATANSASDYCRNDSSIRADNSTAVSPVRRSRAAPGPQRTHSRSPRVPERRR